MTGLFPHWPSIQLWLNPNDFLSRLRIRDSKFGDLYLPDWLSFLSFRISSVSLPDMPHIAPSAGCEIIWWNTTNPQNELNLTRNKISNITVGLSSITRFSTLQHSIWTLRLSFTEGMQKHGTLNKHGLSHHRLHWHTWKNTLRLIKWLVFIHRVVLPSASGMELMLLGGIRPTSVTTTVMKLAGVRS